MFLLNGCAESIAFLGSSVGAASNGRVIQSSLNSALSYGIKKQTGKTPLGHAIAYAEEMNPEKKKETCLSFIEKTRSEICSVVKKQMALTNTKIKDKSLEIIKDVPKKTDLVVNKSINKSKKIFLAEENTLTQFKTSPRKLAIAFQAKLKEKSKNNLLSYDLFKR